MKGTRSNDNNEKLDDREKRRIKREENKDIKRKCEPEVDEKERKKKENETNVGKRQKKDQEVQEQPDEENDTVIEEEQKINHNHEEDEGVMNNNRDELVVNASVRDYQLMNIPFEPAGELNPDDENQLVEFYIAFAGLTEEKRTYYIKADNKKGDKKETDKTKAKNKEVKNKEETMNKSAGNKFKRLGAALITHFR